MVWVMCHLLITQHGPLLSLHILGSNWTTCRVPVVPLVMCFIGTRVAFWLEQVSLLHWTMCRIFIGPCGVTTIPCMSFFYSITCHNVVRSRVSILLGHVSRSELPTCLFLIWPHDRTDLYHIFCLYWPTYPVWLLHVSFTSSSICQILV